jgi:hypothetical protein
MVTSVPPHPVFYISFLFYFLPFLYIGLTRKERQLSANEKPLIIFQQLQKEGRNPIFMLRYAGKSRSEAERDRDERDYRNGAGLNRSKDKDDDPITPKSVAVNGSDRYTNETIKSTNGMF